MDGALVGNIGHDGPGFAAGVPDLASQLLERLSRASHQDDAPPVSRERTSERCTEAAAGAGHDGGLLRW
jgi:hypothetical protein